MKQKITKGKVIQNCLMTTAAIVVAGGVGFQFHEIHGLQKELGALNNKHTETVQELKTTTNYSLSLEEEVKATKKTNKAFSEQIDSLQKDNKKLQEKNSSLEFDNNKLKKREAELSNQLDEERKRPRQVTGELHSNTATSEKVITGVATAYTANCKGCTGTTASGKKVTNGMVAMASWVPLGTKVRITSKDYPSINGVYEVADRGGAIKGNKVDIYMTSHKQAIDFGRRTIQIEILN